MAQAVVVVDLGYGDAGKGGITDFLTGEMGAKMICRFNGGGQAGHHVVTPDGRQHTFSQFGSGMFVPGVRTVLSKYTLVSPLAMLAEAEHLASVGVPDALSRTFIDENALIVTPYHRALNQLRETLRGSGRHGSCGMGIGETVSDCLAYGPEAMLRVGDLRSPIETRFRLELIRNRLWRPLEDCDAAMIEAFMHGAARMVLSLGGILSSTQIMARLARASKGAT